MKKIIVILVILLAANSFAQFPKRTWIRTAAITYGLTDSIGTGFLGRMGNDVCLNISNTAYGSRSGCYSEFVKYNPSGRAFVYLTTSSYRSGADQASLLEFCGLKGISYSADSFFIKAVGSSITLNDIQAISAPCTPGATTTTPVGSYISWCGWSTDGRLAWDYTKPLVREYQIWRATRYMTGNYVASDGTRYHGVIEDENYTLKAANYAEPPGNAMAFPFGSGAWTNGIAELQNTKWAGYTYAQVLDTLLKLKQNVWLKAIGDTGVKYGTHFVANSVTYGAPGSDKCPGDIITTGTGLLPMENALPVINTNLWDAATWNTCDTITKYDKGYAFVWCNIDRADTVAMVAAGGAAPTGNARAKLQRLCYYYMAHNPDRTYFILTCNAPEHMANDYKKTDTLRKWTNAINHNIGRPTGVRFIAQSGNDPAGQSYQLYRRNFENGFVIYRRSNGTNYTNTSAVTYALGGSYAPAYEDGTTGGQASTTQIRNCEGQIFLSAASSSTGNISIGDAVATEGGNLNFVVTLSQIQDSVTTFNYSTLSGTATGGTSCSGATDFVNTLGTGNIPAGQLTATISISTCDDATYEQAENMIVTISAISPSTLTLLDQVGAGTINDNDNPTSPNSPVNLIVSGQVQIGGQTHLGGDD